VFTLKLKVIIPNSGISKETLKERELMLKSVGAKETEISVDCIEHGPESIESNYDEILAGKYIIVGKPIPILYAPLTKLAKLKEESEEFILWETKFVRERNRVFDAISNCIGYIILASTLMDEKLKSFVF